ncbi:MAG: hypothetical protein R2715_00180 [Ilumatobacteraceae bacterium]
MIDRLRGQGYEVTVFDDDVVTAGALSGFDLVIVSSSVVPSKIGTNLAGPRIPVVTWEGYLFDEFGLASSGGETNVNTREITIMDPSHPTAGGLTDSVTLLTTDMKLNRATGLADGVVEVADTRVGATMLRAEVGALLTTGPALPVGPGCRGRTTRRTSRPRMGS